MRILLAVLVVESVIGAASAALKPTETDVHPVDSKAVAVYKTTPQGHLRINLYFPPNWKASDRRRTIVFFFAGSCATGSPAQFAATAEYFAGRGLVAAAAEYRIESVHHTSPERCVEDFLHVAADHARALAERLDHQEASVERFMELSDP